MAIRFACPACRQPLEIDDAWAGQPVACPYCRRVVTAPPSSTWPPGDIPMASSAAPAGPPAPGPGYAPPPPGYATAPQPPGFAPPPPPPGYGPPAYALASRGSAGWGLAMVIIGAGLSMLAFLTWVVGLVKTVMDKLGPNATQEQINRAVQDLASRGQLPHSGGAIVTAFAAVLVSIAGLGLATRALVRQESGRGMAIAACVLGVVFLLCQALLTLMLMSKGMAG